MLTLSEWRSHVAWPALLFGLCLATLIFGGFDRPIANAFFFHPETGWLGTGNGEWWAHSVLHSFGRWLVRGSAVAGFVVWLLSWRIERLAPWRREALFVFCGMVVATGLVGVLKQVTDVDCPWNLSGFGGDRPYVALFADRPDWLPRARCFPGSHSASGFALVSVYFALRTRARRASYVALGVAILVGVAFALGQEARGAHFLSHDLTSAALVWFAMLAMYRLVLAPDADPRTGLREPALADASGRGWRVRLRGLLSADKP